MELLSAKKSFLTFHLKALNINAFASSRNNDENSNALTNIILLFLFFFIILV